jgi:hypothetical protein
MITRRKLTCMSVKVRGGLAKYSLRNRFSLVRIGPAAGCKLRGVVVRRVLRDWIWPATTRREPAGSWAGNGTTMQRSSGGTRPNRARSSSRRLGTTGRADPVHALTTHRAPTPDRYRTSSSTSRPG